MTVIYNSDYFQLIQIYRKRKLHDYVIRICSISRNWILRDRNVFSSATAQYTLLLIKNVILEIRPLYLNFKVSIEKGITDCNFINLM